MNRFLFILLFLLTAASLHAACTQASPGVWTCSDSGDPYVNGVDLGTFLYADRPFACGDVIVLPAGASYRAPDGYLDPYFALLAQTNCGGKKTEIRSSALSDIPLNQKQNLIRYRSKMPSFEVSGNAVFYLGKGANNFKLSGLRLTTTSYAVAHRRTVGNLGFATTFEIKTEEQMNAWRPHDFEIDRCIFEEYEEQAFGDPNTSNTNGNAFLRSAVTAVGGAFTSLYFHDSYVKLAGYTNSANAYGTDWFNITGATNATPATVQGPLLSSLLGVTYNPGCSNKCEAEACSTACKRVVIRGATGAWADLNGPKYVRARSDGNVDVVKLNPSYGGQGTSYYDSTGKGPFTGSSPQIAGAGLLTQYAVLFISSENIRVIDNYLEAWAMPVFLGGGDGPKKDPALIQSGSTATSLVLSHVRDLNIGDVVTFNVPSGSGPSVYCGNPVYNCRYIDTYRSGIVTAIMGTTVTVAPWGPNGTDGTAPQVGALAWWKNFGLSYIEIRGNAISRGYLTSNGDAGKGGMEMKKCQHCIIDGNVFTGYLDENNIPRGNSQGDYFVEAVSQSSTDPNFGVQSVTISNNLASGTLGDGTPSCAWRPNLTFTGAEDSIKLGSDVYYEHNIHVGCVSYGWYNNSIGHIEVQGSRNSGYKHNTYAPNMAQSSGYRFLTQNPCLPAAYPFFPEYLLSRDSPVKDNIIGYGYGAYIGYPGAATCWPTIATDVTHNIIIDTQSIGTASINATFPNNFPVADYTGFWAGTCAYNSWTNCKLHPSNSKRGVASDGGDPGADVEQVRDRIERWSERAGLLQPNLKRAHMELNQSNWQIGSSFASVRFTTFSSLALCTVELFTVRNRSIGHGDTNSPSRQSCSRFSSVAQGNNSIFVFGSFAALTPSTTYFYKITDGTRVMVGEFRTFPARASAVLWPLQLPAASTLTYAASADFSGSTTLASKTEHLVPVPAGGVVYWRVDATGKKAVFVAP